MKRLLLVSFLVFSSASPFEKNHDLVDEGMTLYEAGQFEPALEKFDEALKERPRDPRIFYNRGLALHKAGKNVEAKTAFTTALEFDKDNSLKSKIHYNLGNIAAAEKDNPGAVKEYRKALRADPNDEQARHNLEVTLKNLPPKDPPSSDAGQDGGAKKDGGTPDSGQSDSGTPQDAGTDAGRPDGGQGDGGNGDAGPDDAGSDAGTGDAGQDGGSDGGQPGDGGEGDGGKSDAGSPSDDNNKPGDGGEGDDENGDAGASDAGIPQVADGGSPKEAQLLPDGGIDLAKIDAEKMLDSFKNKEKNLQLWRFKQKGKKTDPNAKDW